MDLLKHPDQPIVDAIYPDRTRVDKRLLMARDNMHAASRFDSYCDVRLERVDGADYLKGEDCPGCGVSEITDEAHGPLKRTPGQYGHFGVSPVRNVCSVCGFSEYVDEMFVRKYGASREHLDAANIPPARASEFFAVRAQKKTRALDVTFMGAISSLELAEYDPATDFEGLLIRAIDREDAATVFQHEDFDDSWWVQIPVDAQRRPLVRWVEGVRWTVTDLNALEAAQLQQRRLREAEVEREIAQLRRQKLAER
jgi:hypothetical protein